MGKAKTLFGSPAQDARMVMHEDEHAIVKVILSRALGDDACFAKIVSDDRSELERAEDRLVLGRFLDRMERQFARRARTGSEDHGGAAMAEVSDGRPVASRPPRRRIGVRR